MKKPTLITSRPTGWFVCALDEYASLEYLVTHVELPLWGEYVSILTKITERFGEMLRIDPALDAARFQFDAIRPIARKGEHQDHDLFMLAVESSKPWYRSRASTGNLYPVKQTWVEYRKDGHFRFVVDVDDVKQGMVSTPWIPKGELL